MIRFLLVLVSIAGPAQALDTSVQRANTLRKDSIVLILNTHENDQDGRGDIDLDNGYFVRDLQKQFPDTSVVIVNAPTKEEITRKLGLVMLPGTGIRAMLIASHGTLFEGSNGPMPVIAGEDLSLFLTDSETMTQTFRPIIGRFQKNAKLIFQGCSLINTPSDGAKLDILNGVASLFGITSGRIYMNETDGMDSMRVMFMQPVYAGGPTQIKLMRVASQILWPALLPASYLADNLMVNSGRTLVLGNNQTHMLKDNFKNAMRNYLSTEEIKAQR